MSLIRAGDLHSRVIMTIYDRRTVLKTAAGVTIAGVLAGCASEGPGADDESDDADHDDEDADGLDDSDEDEYDDSDEDTDDETDRDEHEDAMVRVAHLSPDAPNVDVYVDDDPVLEDVPFRAVSDYLELAPETYTVTITAAGDPDTVAFEDEIEVPEGEFTVAALGELAEENQPFEPQVYEDDLGDPGEQARVRLIHASPDAPAVDVTVEESGDALFEAVEFGGAGAVEVPPGSYTLEVRPASEDLDGDVVATFDVDLEEGYVYSGFAVGYLGPDAAPADEPFDLEVIVDSVEGERVDEDEVMEDDEEMTDDADDEEMEDDATDEDMEDDDDDEGGY